MAKSNEKSFKFKIIEPDEMKISLTSKKQIHIKPRRQDVKDHNLFKDEDKEITDPLWKMDAKKPSVECPSNTISLPDSKVSKATDISTTTNEPNVRHQNALQMDQQQPQKLKAATEEQHRSQLVKDSSRGDTIDSGGGGPAGGGGGSEAVVGGHDCPDEKSKNKRDEKVEQRQEQQQQHRPSHHAEHDEETDIIGDLVGHFGKWQFLMTILLSLFQVPNTFHISSSIYQAANKNFWCKRPANLNHLPVDVWRNLSHSTDNCFQSAVDWSNFPNTSVQRFQMQTRHSEREISSLQSPLNEDLLNNMPTTDGNPNISRISCTVWEYEMNDNLGNTWTSEWDLVCDKEYLKNVAEMFFLLGVATGGIISGYLSDKFGRKTMLFISAVLQTTFGLVLYFAHSFELYITLRALLGLVSVSVTYAGLILAIEYVDGKWRTIAGMYNLFPLPISYMLISGIAYLTQDYKNLQLCIGIPGIFLCFLWFVVPESPRWLLVKGRIDEVKTIIEAAAKFNKRTLPPNYDLELKPLNKETSSEEFTLLFRSGYLRRISICFLCIWFTMNLVYYGLILNMSSFGGNVYLNSALAGLVEIPAIAIAMYIITKVGKKWLFCATFFCAGIACCCAALTEGIPDMLWLKITFLMIGKFTISAGNTIMPVYTAELYPTAIRNAGVGACNVAAGVALILTPYLSLLTKIEAHLLMTLLTCVSLFGGFVILFLPETMSSHSKKNPPEEKC